MSSPYPRAWDHKPENPDCVHLGVFFPCQPGDCSSMVWIQISEDDMPTPQERLCRSCLSYYAEELQDA